MGMFRIGPAKTVPNHHNFAKTIGFFVEFQFYACKLSSLVRVGARVAKGDGL